MAPESIETLRRSGVFAWRTPAAFGGPWASTTAVARSLAEFGRACPSAAWVAGTCATAKTLLARNFDDEEVLGEIFAEPDTLACGSGHPTAQGQRTAEGVRITGRWSALSGCEDSDWAALALTIDGSYSWAYVPTNRLVLDRTWQVPGMRGTGSHTLVADDVLVPAQWVTAGSLPSPADRPFYAIAVLAPIVGAAYGALEVIDAMFASGRAPSMSSYSSMAESAGARQWLAEATHLVDRADRAMMTVAQADERGDAPAELDSARLSMMLAEAVSDCRSAIERMLDLHGVSGFSTANPLQRYWRDIAVASRHPQFNGYLAVERLGAVLAG
ncbi:acyl-CoA dehydrogenase [Amycolatopsis sp. RM579]|uniref:Acyl-CoA dehydrogenase n=1 Tax=Amycolatopsis pithecellobii TaxID=664692 RepID=A0A6N7Z6Q8_9PSEU|nr:acyl-CoA dehydrogenase [Amycolatopsis pithecellobii]